jgi:2-polyprenyl-3-methyl-5-hydroxy-6-metoxy-1,4-benzoquinol methylase
MSSRPCPFCSSALSGFFGAREARWVRCRMCRSVYRDITPQEFGQLHSKAEQDPSFADSMFGALGNEPMSSIWRRLSLPGKSVLEIGAGTGHLLAAAQQAGRSVTAVESSEAHRGFIRDTWGIDSLYADIADVPAGGSFDAIIAINVIEHVYNITDLFRSAAGLLAPGGVFFISTPNGASLEAALLRNWWSMCKEHDHVSFPTHTGMTRASGMAGLRAERVWSAELPFEFPISVLVAARDWARARKAPPSTQVDDRVAAVPVADGHKRATARLAQFYSLSGPFDPTSRLLAALGCAGTIKARLRPGSKAPSAAGSPITT